MGDINVLNYLNEEKKRSAECAAELIEIESLYNDKSWKPLTEKIIALISHPVFRNENYRVIRFYRSFISTFETEIDPHKLVDIVYDVTSFMNDKTQAVEILKGVEDTVKGCDDAVWRCCVLKGQIQLNHLNDLDATKKTIDALSSALGNAGDLPVHWKLFLLATNYHERVLNRLEGRMQEFNRDIEGLGKDNEKLEEKLSSIMRESEEKISAVMKRNEKLEEKLSSVMKESEEKITAVMKRNDKLNRKMNNQQQTFEEQLSLLMTDIEAKFTTEAIRNFEEVINSQTEVTNLRKLNDRLLSECAQIRNQNKDLKDKNNDLTDNNTKLEATLAKIITEQDQQKNALMMMGSLLQKLSLKDGNESAPSGETS